MRTLTRVVVVAMIATAVGAFLPADTPTGNGAPAITELIGTPAAAAQANGNGGGGGLTCGWCEDGLFVMCPGGGVNCHNPGELFGHRFPDGGDECPLGGEGDECSRCGGSSTCHDEPQPEGCHIECGPGGGDEFAAVIGDLEESIRREDHAGIARLIRTVVWVDLSPGGDAVRILAPCGSGDAPSLRPITASLANRVVAATE